MNFKTTLVLLIALVVVGVTIFFVRRDRGSESPGGGDHALVSVLGADVTRLTIAAADGQRLVLEKSGADWKMLEPVAAAADANNVDSLVRDLVDLHSRGQVELQGDNLASTGLGKPSFDVELQAKGGKIVKYKLGNRTTVGDNLYIQLDGEKNAHVIPGTVYDRLDKPFASLRQTRLVTTPAAAIQQIEITRPDEKIALQKTGETWEVTAPQKMPAEAAEVSELTWAITSLAAAEFVNEKDIAPALRPENNPQLTVWISAAAPTTQPTTKPAGTTIRFGGYDSVMKKNVFVSLSDPPTLAKVPATAMESLTRKKPLDLRDRKIVDADPAQVSRLSIVTENPATTQPTTQPASRKEMVLERKKKSTVLGPDLPATQPSTQPTTAPALPETDWTLKGPASGDASQARVEALLTRLHPLRADKYVETAPTTQPATRYMIQIQIESAAQQVQHQIRLTDPGAEKPLIGEYNGLIFEIARTLVQDMTADFANKPEPAKSE